METRRAESKDLEFIVSAYSSAFAFDRSRTVRYFKNTGFENFFIVELASQAAAVFALIRTGHWFAGRSVPACNVAHVAIAPEFRGAGLATAILESAAEKAVKQGAILISLFASTRPLYRKFGFELSGSEVIYEADTAELYKLKDQFNCSRVTEENVIRLLEPVYREQCRTEAGLLDRSTAHWNALLSRSGDELSTFLFETDGKATGYVILDTGNAEHLTLRDWSALSGRTARQILKFLGTFSTVYPRLRWHGSPHDLLVLSMPDKGWKIVHQEEFLMRVLSPKHALEARGYSCAAISLRLDVVGSRHTHTLRLDVADGKASCQENAEGPADITVGDAQFATLFSGFRSAYFLDKAGWISGSSAALRRCNDIFAGPAPWVAEHF